jgi:serine/threonine-protein kinase
VYGFETENETSALIMEYVPGTTLASRLKDGGALPVDDVVEFGIQIAAGLECAHDAGIVHRDLKPRNIIITPERRVKVLDFGLAKVLESDTASAGDDVGAHTVTLDRTRIGAVIGTPAYLSPEQSRGDVADEQSDI